MKISKDARRVARQLMKHTVKDGVVDPAMVRRVVDGLKRDKSRGYIGKVVAYSRLVRLELERRHAVVESATSLDASTRLSVGGALLKKYGDGLTVDFEVNPSLLGGLRVRVGSDVWDGSVKGRLERLRDRIG
jgi:F-type H+-transporting ATPase subunit delta